jgi:hypothetical protein
MGFKQMATDHAAIGSSQNGMKMQRRFLFSDSNVAKEG